MAQLAMKASPHVSWTRTMRGGVVGRQRRSRCWSRAIMVLRALGIGPAGSLLAAGKLSAQRQGARRRVRRAGSRTRRSATSPRRCARTCRSSQRRAPHADERRRRGARADENDRTRPRRLRDRARDRAARRAPRRSSRGAWCRRASGTSSRRGSWRAESGDELASYRESAKDAGDLIPTVDRLTKELRGKDRRVAQGGAARAALDQVPTSSLDALRSYAAGLRANDIQGDYPTAVQILRATPSGRTARFAMAYVQLAVFAPVARRTRTIPASQRGAHYCLPPARPAAGSGAVQRRGSILHVGGGRSREGDLGVPACRGARLLELRRRQLARRDTQ